MADFTVRVVFNRFGEYADAVSKQGAAHVEQTADAIVKDARELVPVKTGALRDSIHRTGTGLSCRVIADIFYAIFIEYGTRKMHARPYFHPAVERNRQGYLAGWRSLLAGTGQRSASVTTYPYLRRR